MTSNKQHAQQNKAEAPTQFVFPISSRTQLRRLVLRNPTGDDLAVKLRASNGRILRADSSNAIVHANEWLAIPLALHIERLTDNVELQFQSLAVFCRRVDIGREATTAWFKDDSDDARFLCASLKIRRLRGFAAPETVLDLPGGSALIETPPFATFDVDDADTQTAHGFDSDTATARDIEPEHWAAVAADSFVSTANRIDADMRTARDMNARGFGAGACWLGDTLCSFYPCKAAPIQPEHEPTILAKPGRGGILASVFPCGSA